MKIPKISKKILVFGLIVVLLVAIFYRKTPIYEGYGMLSGTEGPMRKTDFYAILTECIENIKKHDTILSTIDKNYSKNDLQIDTTAPDMTNIQALLAVMKIQDAEILKLLPTYIPSTDLDGLIDGSLLKPIVDDLHAQSKYPNNPLDCDPVVIQKAITGYQALLDGKDMPSSTPSSSSSSSPPTALSDTEKNVYQSMLSSLKMKLVDLLASKDANGNTKCLPPLSQSDAEGLLDGFYANFIIKIIKSQYQAITIIQNNIQTDIVNFYSTNIAIGKPPSS